MNTVYDVIIVGTGAAGLFCALNFPETKKVCIITKRRADESDSFLAQGGICMLRGEEDYEDYFEDTMRAGHYENNKKTVDLMIRSSNLVIRELIRLGVRFERDESGIHQGGSSQPAKNIVSRGYYRQRDYIHFAGVCKEEIQYRDI